MVGSGGVPVISCCRRIVASGLGAPDWCGSNPSCGGRWGKYGHVKNSPTICIVHQFGVLCIYIFQIRRCLLLAVLQFSNISTSDSILLQRLMKTGNTFRPYRRNIHCWCPGEGVHSASVSFMAYAIRCLPADGVSLVKYRRRKVSHEEKPKHPGAGFSSSGLRGEDPKGAVLLIQTKRR